MRGHDMLCPYQEKLSGGVLAVATAPAVALGRGGFLAQGFSGGLRFDGFAHAFGVEFATFEKIEYLVCGQRIFAH